MPNQPPEAPKSGDTPQDRLAKLLPGDVTAAFLSAKVALVAQANDKAAPYVFWTFVVVLFLCPFYFWFVTKAKSAFHTFFLTASFAVFAISIANVEFEAYFKDTIPQPVIRAVAIVLPILWTYLVTQISVAALDQQAPPNDVSKPDSPGEPVGPAANRPANAGAGS
ncbi:hypothetical protein QRQ56_17900 [Bradyrhizobium sp. U531]|uniref:hypothetical protein n=1 Tax=Bradyrhizobium sp. U531 TaxID=3053458 RepID=UPI003F436B47